MRFSSRTLALALPVLGSAGRLSSREESVADTMTHVAKSFIVEYSSNKVRARDGLLADEAIKIVKDFDSTLFSGASIESDVYNLDDLMALPNIANVWLNEYVTLAPPQPLAFGDDAAAKEYTTHNATGVSKLHNAGILGKGVKVGVVDTGTWYDHPALGGGFGPGFKVAGGWDFVGNKQYPSQGVPEPDADPKDQLGHGTHVSGIIAGKTDFWTGVAPEATLYSYKVFSTIDSVGYDTLIEAFLRAHADGCDIITSSIGGTNGWSNNAWAEVASRIVEDGIVVTISAGNSGDAGLFFPSSGSSGKNVLAVASVETELFPASPFEATFAVAGTSNTVKLGYLPSTFYFPTTVKGWEIRPLTFNTSAVADGCDPWPAGTPRLDGVVPLVRRGTCTFAIKQQNLRALGAEYMLFYNDERPIITPGTSDDRGLIAMITAKAGKDIIDAVLAGGKVTADFSVNPEEIVALDYPAGGRPNTFTSWGALYDLQMKPDIAAPGGQIFSTYLDNKYALLSGTSMACPYVAGVAALYISVHGGRELHGKGFAKMLANRIISSGTALPWSDGTATDYGYAASVAQVGNGLIDAFKVVKYGTQLDFQKMALNDTRYFSRYHDVVITNNDAKDSVTYTFSTQNSAGVEMFAWFGRDYRPKRRTELTPKALVPEISLPRSFTLGPGQSKTVSVNFKNPDTLGWNATAMPVYSGKVIVSGSNGEQLSVPYVGLAADLKKTIEPIYRPDYPFSVSGVRAENLLKKATYTFDLALSVQDFPKIYVKVNWGSRQVRWDIYEAGWTERQWKYPPVPGENGYIGPATCWVGAGRQSWFNPAFYNPDETFTYPVTDIYRNAETVSSFHEYWWFGKLGNGTQIANGNYTMRFAVLKPFGDPTHADNWSVFKTPQISVLGHY